MPRQNPSRTSSLRQGVRRTPFFSGLTASQQPLTIGDPRLWAAFDQIGLLPRQVWADRILDEARETTDPVHLVRLFGIDEKTAIRYAQSARVLPDEVAEQPSQ
ncbi:hypothetical protein OG762_48365 (plasmid) [Streptomyces sp. NBC_01136]|uniref:hypothetical protein n=1 Tax=Streptomyces sp. NBC_01136 TaxID=2903754 RepID=UPI002F90C671|nr:hypothetical protein OG762_48365 [Streptomyces sp. NBC_01136]